MLNHRWAIAYETTYRAIDTANPNPRAHGGVCHVEVRKNRKGQILMRRVNRNAGDLEIGRTEVINHEELDRIAPHLV
jgi:hypothetical protein